MKYFCPCCDSNLASFTPGGADYPTINRLDIVGMGRRLNKNCTNCLSNDRERLVTFFLKKFILNQEFKKIKLLHIAPEHNLREILAQDQRINYVKGDNFSEGYQYPNTLKIDITKTPFRDNLFDFIICNHVLEHIENDDLAIKELFRILKNDGRAILQVPISEKLSKTYENKKIKSTQMKIKYFGQRNHVRIYGWDYIAKLKSVGFEVQTISIANLFGESFCEKLGLNKREKIIFCRKLI